MQTLDGVLIGLGGKKKTKRKKAKKKSEAASRPPRAEYYIATDREILGDEAGLSHAVEVFGRAGDSAGYVQVVDFVVVFMMPVEISLHVLHVIPIDPFRTFRRKSHRNHVLCDDCI